MGCILHRGIRKSDKKKKTLTNVQKEETIYVLMDCVIRKWALTGERTVKKTIGKQTRTIW